MIKWKWARRLSQEIGLFQKLFVPGTRSKTLIPHRPVKLIRLTARNMSSNSVLVASGLTSTIQLNDGHSMPLYGLGVYKAQEGGVSVEEVVVTALKHGYRLLDTAQFYENEAEVGRGIKASGVPREDIFVVTKLFHHGYDECKKSFAESLQKLDLDYVDLFLIHNPRGGKNLESYDAMIELQKEGKIRSIGVSNFNTWHLEEFEKAGKPTPAVNQVELHPYYRQEKLVQYCRKHGIAVMGFTPLTRGVKFADPPLVELAKRLNLSVAQVLLRWSVQRGFITIPKSVKEERIISNADVFNFSIPDSEMKLLDSFPEERCTMAISEYPWEG